MRDSLLLSEAEIIRPLSAQDAHLRQTLMMVRKFCIDLMLLILCINRLCIMRIFVARSDHIVLLLSMMREFHVYVVNVKMTFT